MSNHNDKINQFDACVKKYLRRELKYRLRSITNHSKYNVNISNLSFVDQNKLVVTDTYPSERFSEKLTTRLFEVVIEDELLYEALLSIKPRARELIVLKYWGEMTDEEIGHALDINRRTVNYNKNKALTEMRRFIEEMRNRET